MRTRELTIAGRLWGEEPAVLLVHGWGSRAAGLGPLAGELRLRGISSVALDLPGHGETLGGKPLIPIMAAAIQAVAREFSSVEAVVAHSFGSLAAAAALAQGLEIRRAVLLAPPRDVTVLSERFARALGFSPAVRAAMQRRAEARWKIRYEDMDIRRFCAGSRLPVLIVHDRDDATVPWRDGREVSSSWKGSVFHLTRGLGHRGILADPDVAERIGRFLASTGEARVASLS